MRTLSHYSKKFDFHHPRVALYLKSPEPDKMPDVFLSEAAERIADLVHELRQPLGTIGDSAFYLGLLLKDADPAFQEQLRIIEAQVDRACRVLAETAAALRVSLHCAAAGESLDLTNSQTSVVT
jgi:signal transduction histidine kinase